MLYGKTSRIQFRVTRQSGDAFKGGLQIYMVEDGGTIIQIYNDPGFKLERGKSADVYADILIQNDALSAYLDAHRADTIIAFGVQFGSGGTLTRIEYTDYQDAPWAIVKSWGLGIESIALRRAKNGEPSDEGTSVLADLKIKAGANADLDDCQMGLYYNLDNGIANATLIDLTASIPAAIIGITGSGSLITQTFETGTDWRFMLIFGDDYEIAIAYAELPSAFANVHLSGCSTGGVAFGKFSASTEGHPLFECEYPAEIHGINVDDYSAGEIYTGGKMIYPNGSGGTVEKPIYRRLIRMERSGGGTYIDSEHPITGAETILRITGTVDVPGDGVFVPIGFNDGTNRYLVNLIKEGATLMYTSAKACTYYLMIDYTKGD